MDKRASGILLHITSLPSPFGIGDMGPEAYRFANFLAEAKQSFWQILPLNPTERVYGNSPYHSISAFAVNPLLISPELLVQDGFLATTDCEPMANEPTGRVDYNIVVPYKVKLFNITYDRFAKAQAHNEYKRFCSENSSWLEDFALFVALKAHFNGKAWSEWPPEVRDRQPEALQASKKELHEAIERQKFLQYLFLRQWLTFKEYCNAKGIQIIGDIPIYVDYDSVDVWSHPAIFKLDEDKRPSAVAGVPPDYFSSTGQLWGNPVYQWDTLKERGYDWWIQRMEHTLNLFDVVRIDHFRGLVAYWEIPRGEQTAIHGQWVEAPVYDFFETLRAHFPSLPVIAEDLGLITPDVREVMHHFGLPGMKVLLFAFGEDDPMHPYLPHTYEENAVVYTGTHDNNTVRGWFERETKPEDKKRLFRYLGHKTSAQAAPWELIRLAMESRAYLALIPMQDILGLGEEARMNRPATGDGNWEWQLVPDQIKPSVGGRLRETTEIYGRAPDQPS
jgi:4-alpha-glucanotransferase